MSVVNSIAGVGEEAVERTDFASEFGATAGGDGVAYLAQMMLSAVSDCMRVSVLWGP